MKLQTIDNLLLDSSNLLAYVNNSDDLLTIQLFVNMLIKLMRDACKSD